MFVPLLAAVLLACTPVESVDTDAPTPTPPTPGSTAPTLDVQFPPSGDLLGASVAVFGTAASADGGPVTVTVSSPTGSVTTEVSGSDPSFRIDDVGLQGPAASLVVRATDALGQTTEHTIELSVSPVAIWGANARVEEAGGTLLFVSNYRLVRLDPATGARAVIEDAHRWVQVLRIGDDVFLSDWDDGVYRLDADGPTSLFTVPDMRGISAEPGGTLLVRAFGPYQLYRWDPAAPDALEALLPPQTWPLPEASDGQRGYYATGSGQVRALDFATGAVQTVYTSSTGGAGTVFTTSAGVWLHLQTGELILVDPATGAGAQVYASDASYDVVPSEPDAMVTTADDRVLRVSATGQTTGIYEAPLGSGPGLPGCNGTTLDPVRGVLYTACMRVDGSKELWSIDRRTGDRALLQTVPPQIQSLAWDETGDRLLMLHESGRILGWQQGSSTLDVVAPAAFGAFHQGLQTDGHTAWMLEFCEYCPSGDLSQVDLATEVRTALPLSGDTFVRVPGANPTLLTASGDRLYALDLASGVAQQIHVTPDGSRFGALHLLGPGRALAVGTDRVWAIDLVAGTLAPAAGPWPFALKSGTAATDGPVLYEIWGSLGLAVDPATGQTVAFSR